jgi:hypothetical protein
MNERKIILGRSKSRPLVTCSMNPFQTSILGVFDDFPFNQNQNKSGAEGSRGERGKMILSGEMIPLNDDRMVSAI